MKAPVPPAQLPFMRISATVRAPVLGSVWKKIILASWPPSSMAQPTFSYRRFRAAALAATSWAKGIPRPSAMGLAPDPVRQKRKVSPGKRSSSASITRMTLWTWSAWCRR